MNVKIVQDKMKKKETENEIHAVKMLKITLESIWLMVFKKSS